ncbi:MAG: hypothetical protein KatS3mg002_0294 [Candidatus Woesearchaeota archaeon]|nr:MAG: hypothetical protein KatS3mg002_0294 [Candidatus Woesearchaeota archaeon]
MINIPLSNGDVNDIVLNSVVIFDLGSQNYARYKVIGLDTQGPISGTQRWIRVDFDDDITPPADIGWNDGFIAAPFDPDIPVGWITYAGEQAFNQAMIAYADNMNSWAEFKNGAAYVKTDSSAFTTILSASDTDVQKALETLDTHTHAFSTDATGITTITTNFDGILSGADTNVQFALETIDNHTHPAPAANVIATNTASFDGILSASDTNIQTALDTLDDHSHTAAETSVDATGFVGILSASDTDVQTALSTIDGHTHPFTGADATSINTITTNFNGILSGTDTDVQKALETLDDHTHISTEALQVAKEPTGFPNLTDSTYSFDSTSRTFTIQPASTSFDVWYYGNKFTKTGPENIVISDTDGIHFIYYNSSGVLTESLSPWDLSIHVPVVAIYWNSATQQYILLEERHGLSMDWATHKYLHTTTGTRYVSGFSLSGYTLDSDALDDDVQFDLSSGGVIADEDLEHFITHSASPSNPFEQVLAKPAQIPVMRRTNGAWVEETATNFVALTTGSGRIAYNNFDGTNWTQVEATNNYFVAYWILATNSPTNPIKAIQGQREDSSLVDAISNNTWAGMNLGDFPFTETKLLYRIIYKTSSGYATTIKARIAQIDDYRSVSSLPTTAFVASDHGALSGLADPDHPASAIYTNTTNFNGILDNTDIDVQSALDKLDDHTHPAPDATAITTITTNFDGKLSTSDTDVQKALETLDDHTHTASETSTNAASFSGILSGADTDVQTALETLSAHGHTASEISTVTTNFNGILSGTDTDIQKALETLDDHTHTFSTDATGVTVTTTNFNGALRSSDNTVQKALETLDNYIVSDFDIIVDAAVDGTNAVQTAIASGHRKIGLKDGTYVWTDTIFDFSDGDSLEIIGLGNNVNINIGTPTASTFKATAATKVFSGQTTSSGTVVDITNKKIYTSADYTGNINVGDYLYFGDRFSSGYALGKYTVSAIDSTSITITEQLPFTENIIDPIAPENFWVSSSGINPLSLLIKNVNITFTDTTNEFLNFNASGYPYFSKIEFNNVIFNDVDNFDYDGWPVNKYIFKDCEIYSSTNGDIYANAEFINCLIDGVQITYALGFKNCVFEQKTTTRTNISEVFGYSSAYILNCHYKNSSYTTPIYIHKGTRYSGNTGILRDSGTYIVSGFFDDWTQNPVQRTVTTSETLRLDDQIILTNHSTPITLTLPSTSINGKKLIFKDVSGNASTNSITLSPTASTIDGQSSFIINENYASITLIYNSTLNMWIVL